MKYYVLRVSDDFDEDFLEEEDSVNSYWQTIQDDAERCQDFEEDEDE